MAARTRQNELLAVALARGASYVDAARASGVSTKTVQRRMQEADFRRRVRELRGQMIDGAAGQLADAATQAVTVLVQLLQEQSPSIRLAASRAILEHCQRFREQGEVVERVEALEEQLGVTAPTGGNSL